MGRGIALTDQQARLSWPYLPFVLVGLAATWYGAEQSPSSVQRWVARIALILWCGLVIPQGNRLLVVQAVLAVLAICCLVRGRKVSVGFKFCAVLLLAYCAAAFFGYLRILIPATLSGEMNSADVTYFLQEASPIEQIKPEHSELAGPYLSLLQAATNSHGEILDGNSYALGFISILPKFLYPGDKPIYLSERFAESVHSGDGPVAGWGLILLPRRT